MTKTNNRQINYSQAIHEAIDISLTKDPSVFLIGLGVTDPDHRLEIMQGDEEQLKLSYDSAKYTTMWTDASSNFYIKPKASAGEEIML